MNVIKTNIGGVVIIEPGIHENSRGYFFESFSQREFDEKVKPITFVLRYFDSPFNITVDLY